MRLYLLFGSLTAAVFVLCTSITEVLAEPQEPITQDTITTAATVVPDSADDLSDNIHKVIEKQLRAFREHKSGVAFDLNAQSLKDQYRDEDHFMRIVRMTYRPIANHVSYKFLDYSQIGENLVQKVSLTNKDGSQVTALIHLKQNADKSAWKIKGYTILDAQDAQPI